MNTITYYRNQRRPRPPQKRRRVRFLWRLPLVIGFFVMAVCLLFSLVPPVSSFMLQSLIRGDGMRRDWTPLTDISPQLVRAVIASEDARFCLHAGIDWKAARKAYNRNESRGRITHGASTIPMQLAKNLFLWQGRSWLRKGIEIPLALWLDLTWTKRRMMEVYLNIADWGDGRFGAERAAQESFGIPASQLSGYQAALLAAALPNPHERRTSSPDTYHRERAASIQARMTREDASCVLR